MRAKYIGSGPGDVRIDDRPVMPGDVIAGPPDVVLELLGRIDFAPVDDEPPATSQEE